jgi:hypothetical protein
VTQWRPSPAELTAHFRHPRPWGLSLARFPKGIDNAHVDVLLSARLRECLGDMVRKRLLEDLRLPPSARGVAAQMEEPAGPAVFREGYLGLFRATLETSGADAAPQRLALLQVVVLKALLQTMLTQGHRLYLERRWGAGGGPSLDRGRTPSALTPEERPAGRRVLRMLFRQLRVLENTGLADLRRRIAGGDWPLPEGALLNPVLAVLDLGGIGDLAEDYPAALLADARGDALLLQTNQCISKVFQYYLPGWTQMPSDWEHGAEADHEPHERLDQGQLRAFLETEILLKRFVPVEEFRQGRRSWLDEPENLRLFLEPAPANGGLTDAPPQGRWAGPDWAEFRRAMVAELHRCLDMHGLARPVAALYRLSGLQAPSGRPIPVAPLMGYLDGRVSRRQLLQRLERMRLDTDPSEVARVADALAAEISRLPPAELSPYLNRYLVDFLTLRRDLKLAYLAYEAMDGIRLLGDRDSVELSRSNGTLIEFDSREEPAARVRRIRGHTVIKADLRGSTAVTEQLRARGLNPASHFSLNFFEPVNRLLPEFGAEKLFVEGDAVILAIMEYEGEDSPPCVARACGLAGDILRVVALQNADNARHGLPELELGLGIAHVQGEPNFLFDEGRPLMISAAINSSDRLSGSSSRLMASGFAPESGAFRVAVVSDPAAEPRAAGDGDLLRWNVNGIRVGQEAFFKLQRELRLQQVRVPGDELGGSLFFTGAYSDMVGRRHWLVLRYGPVRVWDGSRVGEIDPRRRHFFEVIADEALSARVRRLAGGEAP